MSRLSPGISEKTSKPGGLDGRGLLLRGEIRRLRHGPEKLHYDEMFESSGVVRPLYRWLSQRMAELTPAEFEARQRTVDLLLRNQGVTFTVYSDKAGIEKVFPFDPIPRLHLRRRSGSASRRGSSSGPRR